MAGGDVTVKTGDVKQNNNVNVSIEGAELFNNLFRDYQKNLKGAGYSKYWRSETAAINEAARALQRFVDIENKANASHLIKSFNAIKAAMGEIPSLLGKTTEEMQALFTRAVNLSPEDAVLYSPESFKEAFSTFSKLEEFGYNVVEQEGHVSEAIRSTSEELERQRRQVETLEAEYTELLSTYNKYRAENESSDLYKKNLEAEQQLRKMQEERNSFFEREAYKFDSFLVGNGLDGLEYDFDFDEREINKVKSFIDDLSFEILQGKKLAKQAERELMLEYSHLFDFSKEGTNVGNLFNAEGLDKELSFITKISEKLDELKILIESTSQSVGATVRDVVSDTMQATTAVTEVGNAVKSVSDDAAPIEAVARNFSELSREIGSVATTVSPAADTLENLIKVLNTADTEGVQKLSLVFSEFRRLSEKGFSKSIPDNLEKFIKQLNKLNGFGEVEKLRDLSNIKLDGFDNVKIDKSIVNLGTALNQIFKGIKGVESVDQIEAFSNIDFSKFNKENLQISTSIKYLGEALPKLSEAANGLKNIEGLKALQDINLSNFGKETLNVSKTIEHLANNLPRILKAAKDTEGIEGLKALQNINLSNFGKQTLTVSKTIEHLANTLPAILKATSNINAINGLKNLSEIKFDNFSGLKIDTEELSKLLDMTEAIKQIDNIQSQLLALEQSANSAQQSIARNIPKTVESVEKAAEHTAGELTKFVTTVDADTGFLKKRSSTYTDSVTKDTRRIDEIYKQTKSGIKATTTETYTQVQKTETDRQKEIKAIEQHLQGIEVKYKKYAQDILVQREKIKSVFGEGSDIERYFDPVSEQVTRALNGMDEIAHTTDGLNGAKESLTDISHAYQEAAIKVKEAMSLLGKDQQSRKFLNDLLTFQKQATDKKNFLENTAGGIETEAYKSIENMLGRVSELSRVFDTIGPIRAEDINNINEYISELDALKTAYKKAGISISEYGQQARVSAEDALISQEKQYQLQQKILRLKNKKGIRGTEFETELNKEYTKSKAPDLTIKQSREISGRLTEINTLIEESGINTTSWFDKVNKSFESMMGWSVVTAAMFKTVELARELVENVVDIDTAMTDLKKVTNNTQSEYNAFLANASSRAKTFGATISDTIAATADMARTGQYTLEEASALGDSAVVYKNVGDDISNISEAAGSIVSAMTAFDIKATDSMLIVDKFNEVGNNFAITSTGVGEALSRSAAAMAAGNNTIDETIGLITAANTVVNFVPRYYGDIVTRR